jgi:predicted dehydrogenase
MSNTPSRRDFVRTAAAVTAAAGPAIHKARGQNNTVQYGLIGSGSRGQYHLKHLKGIDAGRCVSICDIYEPNAQAGAQVIGTSPKLYKDYREMLADKNVEAVIIATPLFTHFPITQDSLLAGKHVFCEKSLVFKPEEIHALRALVATKPKQVMQTGLQRRYSAFYQTAKQMVDKGMIGKVTNVYAQWNRNGGWTMKKQDDPSRQKIANWRLFREYSGGLTAELASHQIDVADWMFGSHPEFVVGVGGLDYAKDGRDVFDNIGLIYRYPQGQRLMYSSISTNSHLPLFGATRTEFGECIMGTEGTIEITVGTDNEAALGLWYVEPKKATAAPAAGKKEPAAKATASLASTGKGGRALPILLAKDQITGNESFVEKEMKFARRWLYSKGVMVPEEDKNPVDVQMEEFFACCRTLAKPKADLEVGLEDSSAVILSNLAMDEGRRVYFNEIDSMGKGSAPKKKA